MSTGLLYKCKWLKAFRPLSVEKEESRSAELYAAPLQATMQQENAPFLPAPSRSETLRVGPLPVFVTPPTPGRRIFPLP